jgi:SagB-type dehydrogenase family enzyme
MKPRVIASLLVLGILLPAAILSHEDKDIKLPAPETEGGRPLMQVLKDRSTSREYSTSDLEPQVLSNLLWAAFGINREESGKRTAPSAMNWQEIDIYVATAGGLYLFDAEAHALKFVLPGDIRAATGKQDFVAVAPVNLVYVADYTKMGNASDSVKEIYSAADTGFIAQNVYLFCASEGLATVVRGYVDKEELAKVMRLSENQRIVFSQTVGYPGE